jgi:HAAS
VAEPIDAWMQQLRDALASEPRLRKTRIVDEARDHLHSSADELEQRGMSRRDAEAKAVGQLGDPRRFAREFSAPARLDWLVDATAWWSSRAAAALLGLGALMVAVEILAWSIGSGPVSAFSVTVWRTCRHSINGVCAGGWNETHAPSLVVLGAICLVAGVIVLAVHWLLRRRYSDLELMPRVLDVGTQVSLATLGAVLLIGGATRSSLDASWQWVSLWLPVGLACIGAALLLHRANVRRQKHAEGIAPGTRNTRSVNTVYNPPA